MLEDKLPFIVLLYFIPISAKWLLIKDNYRQQNIVIIYFDLVVSEEDVCLEVEQSFIYDVLVAGYANEATQRDIQ